MSKCQEMEERILNEAFYIIKTKQSIRNVAEAFKISKSSVHKDLTIRLEVINPSLYSIVSEILMKNLKERHLRGGEATKKKYDKK